MSRRSEPIHGIYPDDGNWTSPMSFDLNDVPIGNAKTERPRGDDIFCEDYNIPPEAVPTNSNSDNSNEPSGLSKQIFKATVFLSVPNQLPITKFGLVLLKKLKSSILLYDKSKKNMIYTNCDETSYVFDESTLTVKFESKIGDNSCTLFVTFIDISEFSRFAVTLLLHTTAFSSFTLANGKGDCITQDCSVLYDTVKYSLFEEELDLPESESNIKCKLSEEKLNGNFLYRHFIGLSKGADILVKQSSSLVTKVKIRKVKWPVEKVAENEIIEDAKTAEAATEEIANLKERMAKIGRKMVFDLKMDEETAPNTITDEETAPNTKTEEETAPNTMTDEEVQQNCVEPTSPMEEAPIQPTVPNDLYEILHRVVGVEMDRIQFRIDSRLDAFRNEVLERLDRQNKLYEEILKKLPHSI